MVLEEFHHDRETSIWDKGANVDLTINPPPRSIQTAYGTAPNEHFKVFIHNFDSPCPVDRIGM